MKMGQINTTAIQHTSNDELINTLIKGNTIRTMIVEKVLRCVDRGFYFTDVHKIYAYRDVAWQANQIHLSAPAVYATVLECLELKPGNKFLNIGSGIGYLSTVAGLLLGRNGVNHGIEIHQLLIDNAYQKVEEFKLSAAAIDHYDFCEPVFVQGNVCELLSVGYYDRVYCGAGVSIEKADFMKSLIKIGGILVMPVDGVLLKVIRNDEDSWDVFEVLDVSFADLVIPEKCSLNSIKFPTVEPLSLQDLCRSNIRSVLRNNLKVIHPSLQMRTKCQKKSYVHTRNISYEDPIAQFIQIQYGINEIGTFNMHNIFDLFANHLLSDGLSDSESELEYDDMVASVLESEAESSEEESEQPCSEELACLQHIELSDESTKRKSQDNNCSEQQSVSSAETTTENPKRLKLDSLSSQNNESVSSSSSSTSSESWETLSTTDSSVSSSLCHTDDDSVSWPSCLDMIREDDHDGSSSSSDEDNLGNNDHDCTEEEVGEWDMCNFNSNYKENELSKQLKIQIDSLKIPIPLKRFLNYNRTD